MNVKIRMSADEALKMSSPCDSCVYDDGLNCGATSRKACARWCLWFYFTWGSIRAAAGVAPPPTGSAVYERGKVVPINEQM